ncbi:hypothetical protein EVAR_77753_1 [Eumeta japonica]|uniref:Uncharacterized protein n=1 Tax=Eumeta variegata TaxID=151549 RepID=A0A4C1TBW1_EUMVA|nr:hypothetical protein EVAR_77753_1 [Eumeta japonica]
MWRRSTRICDLTEEKAANHRRISTDDDGEKIGGINGAAVSWLLKRERLSIPRNVGCSNPVIMSLHVFSDAFLKAYATCVYVRSADALGNITVRFLCAKAKVKPLKNPADLASRRVYPDELQSLCLWWEGPSYLKDTQDKWPEQHSDTQTNLPELRVFTAHFGGLYESAVKSAKFHMKRVLGNTHCGVSGLRVSRRCEEE